ncbi:MAG: hypothetical protein ABWY06_24870 [Pseudomonas sp.]|uniref:hypothetical protein n=1 Tax=Pseudomonas sp. TaxID=306 RepID=UPI0033967540
MKKKNPEKLIAWLKYLDVEYLDDSVTDVLVNLKINDVADQEEIINLAMKEEVNSLGEDYRLSLLRILDEVTSYPENEAREIIGRIGMPFDEPLLDYKAFFSRVRKQLFAPEESNSWGGRINF